MPESAYEPPVEQRINEHLDAIDKALAAKGISLAERRSVTGDVEAQIREMLTLGSGNAPTLADLEAVLRKLDAPESYGDEADNMEEQPVSSKTTTVPMQPVKKTHIWYGVGVLFALSGLLWAIGGDIALGALNLSIGILCSIVGSQQVAKAPQQGARTSTHTGASDGKGHR